MAGARRRAGSGGSGRQHDSRRAREGCRRATGYGSRRVPSLAIGTTDKGIAFVAHKKDKAFKSPAVPFRVIADPCFKIGSASLQMRLAILSRGFPDV